jgi:3-phosphoshikimate 1-carboxyvinyltransferase
MAALGGKVTVDGLSLCSSQGDKEVLSILERFGAVKNGNTVSAGRLRGIDIDASHIPDLVPILAVAAAAAEGQTRISGAGRLALKESDRLQTTQDMLTALGANVNATSDGLVINGKPRLPGGTVCGAGDHRIVMAAAAASCVCDGPIIIRGCEAVNKSYPTFFDDFRAIGGQADVVSSGE